MFSREYLKGRVGIFFALVFPVILILLFGAIFSGSSGSVVLHVQNDDSGQLGGSLVEALNFTGALTVVMVSPSENMSSYMLRHSYSGALKGS